MNTVKSVILLGLAAFLVLPLSAQEKAEAQPLTLEDCVSTAIQYNPLILSSLQQHQASLARVSQARAFDQPSLNWDSDLQDRLFDFKNAGEWYFGISQAFEFPGKKHIKGKIAGKESEEILQEIDLLKLDITFQVKQAFFRLLLAQEKLTYVQQDLDLSQDFLNKAQVKFEAGDVAQVEVLRARVEVSKVAVPASEVELTEGADETQGLLTLAPAEEESHKGRTAEERAKRKRKHKRKRRAKAEADAKAEAEADAKAEAADDLSAADKGEHA